MVEKSTTRLAPRCRTRSHILRGLIDPHLFLPSSWEGWLTGQAYCRYPFAVAVLGLVCPSAHRPRCFLFGLLAQPVIVSLLFSSLSRIVSFGGLVVDVGRFVAIVVVVHLLVARCWLRDLPKETRIVFWGRPPLVCRVPVRNSSLYTPLGRGADPHHHIVRPEKAG